MLVDELHRGQHLAQAPVCVEINRHAPAGRSRNITGEEVLQHLRQRVTTEVVEGVARHCFDMGVGLGQSFTAVWTLCRVINFFLTLAAQIFTAV